METTHTCGHAAHTPGCGPCEAGMARLREVDCPRCRGAGCPSCGGEGHVYAFPVRPCECAAGLECPIGPGPLGRERASA